MCWWLLPSATTAPAWLYLIRYMEVLLLGLARQVSREILKDRNPELYTEWVVTEHRLGALAVYCPTFPCRARMALPKLHGIPES